MSVSVSTVVTSAAAGALISAVVAVTGWFVTMKREENRRRLDVDLQNLRRKIDELYGPLVGLLYEQAAVWDVITRLVPMDGERPRRSEFGPQDWEKWNFFSEHHLIPIQRKVMDLVWAKVHLLNENTLPASLAQFIRNAAQFEALHTLYVKKHVRSDHVQGQSWPEGLLTELESTLTGLKARHEVQHGRAASTVHLVAAGTPLASVAGTVPQSWGPPAT